MLELAHQKDPFGLAPARSRRAHVMARLRTAALLAPFAGALASAQDSSAADQLGNAAKTQMGGVVALLVAILLVGIGITVMWFANKNVKKGVNKSG